MARPALTTVGDQIFTNMQKGKSTLIYGPAGSGKTFAVNLAAQKLELPIFELNSSTDLTESGAAIASAAKSSSFLVPRTVFIIEDADNFDAWPLLEQMLSQTTNPIFMLCIGIPSRMPAKLKSKFDTIRYPEPKLVDVVAIVKSKLPKDTKADFRFVTTDIRQSILNVQGGAENYKPESTIEEIEQLLNKGILSPNLEKHQWLFKLIYVNLPRFFIGPDLFLAFEVLKEAQYYNKPQMLLLLPRGRGKAIFPKDAWRR